MYKSKHLAYKNIKIVNQHIKNTQNHISLGNYKLKQQWSSTAENSKKEGAELLWWLSGKQSAWQCNTLKFDPLPRKIPHATEKHSWIFPQLNKAHLWLNTTRLALSKQLWKTVQTKSITQLYTTALLVITKTFQISGCLR